MKKATLLAVACALSAAAFGAHAQTSPMSNMYVEGSVASVTTDFGDGLKYKPRTVAAIVGYNVHPNLAVEGMLGLNASKGTATIRDVDSGQLVSTSLKYTSTVGVFIKPRVAINNEAEVFARLGYVQSRAKATAGTTTLTDTDEDFAYGLGANYNFDKNLYATLGYMVYYKKDDVKSSGFNVGVGYRF